MVKPTNELKCTFPSTSQNEALARSIVSGFLMPLDPDIEELADIRCAVSEAVTNCVVHAYKGTQGPITITVKCYDDRTFRMTVADRGCGIPDVNQARKPLYTTAPDEDRCGMGFSIMESFADRLLVSSHVGKGTKVTFIKKLSEASYI